MSTRDGVADIYVMSHNGSAWGTPERLVGCGPGPNYSPALSPDGTYIAFGSNRDLTPDGKTDPEIYVMPLDGSSPPGNITNDPAGDGWPEWRPGL